LSTASQAYWAPLLHLLCFGLSWTRPDVGIARWSQLGRPLDDPVLRVINRWWGSHIEDFLAWAAVTPTLVDLGEEIVERGHYNRFNRDRLPDAFGERRRDPAWLATWDGGVDQLHLTRHALTPIEYPERGITSRQHNDWQSQDVPRRVVIVDGYPAWHASLWHYRPTLANNGRSIRTDVVCKPIGWLGEYRHSRTTGAWFRGQHRWHELGA
jgi:hypothetical protein